MINFFQKKKKSFHKNSVNTKSIHKNKILAKMLPKNYYLWPWWKKILLWLGYAFVVFVVMTIIAFMVFYKDLPTPSKIANLKMTQSTKLYDRTGKTLLYETGNEKRTIVKSENISDNLKKATVAVEDSNFYSNHGFETRAIFRAVFYKLIGKTNRIKATSTITQQFVKNAMLNSDRSLSRKIKELILSIEVEVIYNKDEILTMYLNEVPYGNSTGGCEAASQMYYGISCKDLNLSQAATLAAMPQAPTYYSPYGTHTDALKRRKNYVLDRMALTGKITKEEAKKAKEEDTTTVNVSVKQRKYSISAPHFVMYTLEQVVDKYGEEAIQKDGLNIITTLDVDKQEQAEKAIEDNLGNLKKNNAENAAIVSVDPKTGQILNMVGSIDYFNTDIDGNVNITDSLRQPGSSFKVFEYSTLFKQKKYSPSSILFDVKTNFSNGSNGYTPQNYNGRFNGAVTIRYALQNSLNIPAIKALSLAGLDNTIKTAKDMGITTLTNRSDYGLSLALGVGEVKPVEMASAYATLANGGVHEDLTPYLKITSSNGEILYDFNRDHKSEQVLDPQIAYEMSNILSDNDSRKNTFGARSALYFSDHTVAAKTGTTQDNKDGWTCGYTPSIATVVWTGNNMPSAMRKDAVEIAGPIFHKFMASVLSGTPNENFIAPSGIQTLTVEKYSNKLPSELSTETTTDIFTSWQVPTEKDDVHIKARVCTGTDLLAPSGMNNSLTEEKNYINLHSERPDYSNWEEPVIAWLKGSNLYNPIPTNYCSGSTTPSISINSPANDSALSGSSQISINTSNSPTTIKSVEYFIDSESIGSGNSSDSLFSLTYDFSSLSSGSHKLIAKATDVNNTTATDTITIHIGANSEEITISNLSVIGLSSSQATISWTTDISTTGKVLYSVTSGGLYSTQTSPGTGTNHSINITNLSSGTKYYFKVISDNNDGNSKTSGESSFTTLN